MYICEFCKQVIGFGFGPTLFLECKSCNAKFWYLRGAIDLVEISSKFVLVRIERYEYYKLSNGDTTYIWNADWSIHPFSQENRKWNNFHKSDNFEAPYYKKYLDKITKLYVFI